MSMRSFDEPAPVERPLPNFCPEVTFDINMGETYDYVDFDYEAYMALASQIGLSEEEANNITIRVKPKLPVVSGAYDPHTKEIFIKSHTDSNRSLAHELKHAADAEQGDLGSTPRRVLGNLGIVLSYPNLVALYAGLGISSIDLEKGLSILRYSGASGLVLAAAIGWGYWMHPSEIRAREAADAFDYNVLTLEKRLTR